MAVTDMSEVAAHVEREVREAMRMPQLDAVRAVLNEAGLRRARVALAASPDAIDTAQRSYREAQAAEAQAREAHVAALSEAEWTLDGRFFTDGNRVYLRLDCLECGGKGTYAVDGTKCSICDGIGSTRKQMTAEERKAWKAQEARNVPAVQAAERALCTATETTAAARDAIALTEKRFSAAKYDLQGAIAELNALAIGLTSKGA